MTAGAEADLKRAEARSEPVLSPSPHACPSSAPGSPVAAPVRRRGETEPPGMARPGLNLRRMGVRNPVSSYGDARIAVTEVREAACAHPRFRYRTDEHH